jgi:addiction module HigA family antidote
MLAISSVEQQILDLTEKPLDETSDALGVIAPGETLRQWSRESGLTQGELARRVQVSTKHMHALIQGRVALMPGMAMRLEDVTGISARAWLMLELDFQLGLLRGAVRCGG